MSCFSINQWVGKWGASILSYCLVGFFLMSDKRFYIMSQSCELYCCIYAFRPDYTVFKFLNIKFWSVYIISFYDTCICGVCACLRWWLKLLHFSWLSDLFKIRWSVSVFYYLVICILNLSLAHSLSVFFFSVATCSWLKFLNRKIFLPRKLKLARRTWSPSPFFISRVKWD